MRVGNKIFNIEPYDEERKKQIHQPKSGASDFADVLLSSWCIKHFRSVLLADVECCVCITCPIYFVHLLQ